jgi:excisionase family DNA binding protein
VNESLPPVLTIAEAAALARVSVDTARRRIASGAWRSTKDGRIVRVHRDALLRLLGLLEEPTARRANIDRRKAQQEAEAAAALLGGTPTYQGQGA